MAWLARVPRFGGHTTGCPHEGSWRDSCSHFHRHAPRALGEGASCPPRASSQAAHTLWSRPRSWQRSRQVFLDEAAATAALATVPTLQKLHHALVPKQLDEKAFFINFFSHLTAIVDAAPA